MANFTCAEPNAYATCKIYKLYLSQRSARSIDLACAKDFILNKMAGKEECAYSSCLETTKYTCLRCKRLKKKKKHLFLMCRHTSNRQKLSNTGYIKGEASRLLRTKSSKTTFEENITLFKQRLSYRGYLNNLIDKTLSEVNFSERISALQNKQKSAKTFCRLLQNIALLCLT